MAEEVVVTNGGEHLTGITFLRCDVTDRRRGVIHNVSSAVGFSGFAGIYGYASAKGAIEALTRTLAA